MCHAADRATEPPLEISRPAFAPPGPTASRPKCPGGVDGGLPEAGCRVGGHGPRGVLTVARGAEACLTGCMVRSLTGRLRQSWDDLAFFDDLALSLNV